MGRKKRERSNTWFFGRLADLFFMIFDLAGDLFHKEKED
jgi:hypothetical protein